MAKITNFNYENQEIFYKVEGPLTEEDVKKINSFTSQVILVLDNTAGQKSEIINMIDNDYVLFSVRGGINPDEKAKYKGRDYFDRTLMSPKALCKVIEYFENIERMIKPEWTETQKAMFLYGALARDNSYDHKDYYSDIHNAGTTLRSLNGLLYQRQVCAGFALSFKEGMDRLGIPCLFRNRMHEHDYNLIEVDGKIIGVDLTWDLTTDLCDYRWFGSEDFISNKEWGKYHTPKEESLSYFSPDSFDIFFDVQFDKSIVQDPSERIFDLDSISKSEIQSNIDIIRNSLLSYNNEAMTNIDISDTSYYPLYGNYIRQERFEKYVSPLKEELTSELDYYELAKILQQIDSHKEDAENYLNILGGRYGFILDVLAGDYNSYGKTGIDYGISELSEFDISEYGFDNYKFKNLSQEEKDRIYDLLGAALNRYLNDALLNLYSNCDKFIDRYESLEDEFDYYKMDILGKLQVLLKAKEHLLSLGINREELEQKLDKVNKFFERFEKTPEEKFNDMIKGKKAAMEFYSMALSDGDTMRTNAEIVNENPFTDEEWIEKLKDLNFMKKVLEQLHIGNNKLYNHDLTDEELAALLDVLKKVWGNEITPEEADKILFQFIDNEYGMPKQEQVETLYDDSLPQFQQMQNEFDSVSASKKLMEQLNTQEIKVDEDLEEHRQVKF